MRDFFFFFVCSSCKLTDVTFIKGEGKMSDFLKSRGE